MSRHLSTRKISSKSTHAFLSNLGNRPIDRQSDKRDQSHLPPPLSEVSPNCIKKQKNWRETIFNIADGIITPCNVARSWRWFRQVTAPCNGACGSGIETVNSPSGSTLQYDTWLWDDMPCNSPKRPPYWNSTPGFDFDHITAVDMSFCTSLRNFIQIGLPLAEENEAMSIFKMADLSHLGF